MVYSVHCLDSLQPSHSCGNNAYDIAPHKQLSDTEKRQNWYGNVKRRDEGHVLGRMLDAPVPGKRWRGRQKTRRKDSGKIDMESVSKGVGRTGQNNVE